MGKNRSRLFFLLFLVLATIGAIFLLQPDSSTLNTEMSDFALEDTSTVDKIFLSDKGDRNILLEKREGSWIVNGLYRAREDAVSNLLYTMKELKVRTPVPKSAYESIVKRMAGTSVKVEIYQGGENPTKVYYVGNSNPDHTGTYMLLEGSSVPFVMHLEGMYGYLGPRFFTNLNEWRTHEIFASQESDIKSVEVVYPDRPGQNFVIASNDDGAFGLIDPLSGNFDPKVDSIEIFRYLGLYERINFEGFEETKTGAFRDSITSGVPMAVILLTNSLGFPTEVKLYKKPMPEGTLDFDGNLIPFDLDRLYALVNDRDFVVVQYFVMDPLLRKREDFLLP